MKRLFDLIASFSGLLLFSPFLFIISLLIWSYDRKTPFYISTRVGLNGTPFTMVKFRSMTINADQSGVDSTSANDPRITPVGRFVRKYKLDELMQLVNVFVGTMSLVGPRPNVLSETSLYTSVEKNLLTVKPGITDFSSIVFSDEAIILRGCDDPDLSYNQLIRPTKSMLGLFYVANGSFFVDISLIIITLVSLLSRQSALSLNCRLLNFLGAPHDLLRLASRKFPLTPAPPPGSDSIVLSRT